ncbi:hypothetical protein HW555_001014 [Spodoptera exigua]|uniref:RWD domain-containing protein n=1 Tax=Spodoptera exigua TaxID=7107 RepID=A0A835GTX1_SPOEX|nr:hypothetical protein HW555_001014 [Spodoptera exigua]
MPWVDEIEALASIYEQEFSIQSNTARSYGIIIKEKMHEVYLYWTMPGDYPSQSPPSYELSAPWMDRKTKEKLHQCLDDLYLNNKGECVIFQWVERKGMFMSKPGKIGVNRKLTRKNQNVAPLNAVHNGPEITHGEVIVDRKSIFQGHAARVNSVDDVKAVLATLKLNRKIQNAKHNIVAYRIEQRTAKGHKLVQEFDEDGEAHSGGRMLHLLQVHDLKNTVVVVTRWFGGIQIGPDGHITNAAKQAIQQAGLLNK